MLLTDFHHKNHIWYINIYSIYTINRLPDDCILGIKKVNLLCFPNKVKIDFYITYKIKY